MWTRESWRVWWYKFIGGLSTAQLVVFLALIGGGIGINLFYLDSVIVKVQQNAANPDSVLTLEATPFPDFVLLLLFASNSTRASTHIKCWPTPTPFIGVYGDIPSFPDCDATSGSVITVIDKDLTVTDGGPTGYIRAVIVHSVFWSSGINTSIYVSVPPLPANTTSDGFRNHGLGYGVKAADADPTDIEFVVAYQGSPSYFYTLSLSATVNVALNSTATPSVTLINSGFRGFLNDSSTVLALNSNAPYTNNFVAWNRQRISYDWKDATASFFSILTTTVTAVFVCFPVTPLVPHRRLFILEREVLPAPTTTTTTTAVASAAVGSSTLVPLMETQSPSLQDDRS